MTLTILANRYSRASINNRSITRICSKKSPIQRRTIWQGSRYTRIGRTSRTDRQRPQPPEQEQQKEEDSWNWRSGSGPRQTWGWGWGGGGFNTRPYGFFETERLRMQRRMEQIKKEVDADPYTALFGRRLDRMSGPDPSGLWGKQENSLSNFCRSVFGLDKHRDKDAHAHTGGSDAHAKTTDTTGRVKSSGRRSRDTQLKGSSKDSTSVDKRDNMDARGKDLEFDPISGRMVKKPDTRDMAGEDNKSGKEPGKKSIQDGHLGYLSPVKPSGENRVASDSAEAEDAQQKEPEEQHEVRQTGEKEVIDMAGSKDHSPELPQTQQQAPSSLSKDAAMNDLSPVSPECKDVNASSQNQSLNGDTRQAGNLAQFVQSGLHPDTAESSKDESPEPQIKTPKLKIQDSNKQPEPILVSENEELDLLRASDIRNSYGAKELDQKYGAVDKQLLEKEVKQGVHLVNGVDAQGIQEKPQERYPLSVDEKSTQATACTEARQSQLQDTKAPESALPQAHENADSAKALEQASDTNPPTSNEPSSSATYRVLAYDSSTMQVIRADTKSSFPSVNEVLHPTKVLPRLNNPARFLPYFMEMQKDGYEIVSGGGDILIFKKSSDAVDGTKCLDGTRNKHAEISERPLKQPTSTSSPKLTQKPSGEPTETNTSRRKDYSVFGNAIRRMLFAGTATAATCYAIGVVGEYFRTGGQDGHGIDGFTEFESERRHRD